MLIGGQLLAEMVAHAREDAPNECCGVLAVQRDSERRAVAVHRARNAAASPLRFEIDGLEVLRIIESIEDGGLELGGIYHSHTRTAPYPSQTDINFAAGWPGVEWVIIGLAERERPQLRSYLIDGAQVEEVPLDEVGEGSA